MEPVFCTCSLSSPGWEHGWFLLHQSQFEEHSHGHPGWGFHMALPELSSPQGSLGRRGEPCWAALGVPTFSWQHQLMALPLATLPDGCLALLEPAQLRQLLQPLSPSCQAESCVWEPLGALRSCPQPLPGSVGVSGHCMVTRSIPRHLRLPWHLCHQRGFPGAVRNRGDTWSMTLVTQGTRLFPLPASPTSFVQPSCCSEGSCDLSEADGSLKL